MAKLVEVAALYKSCSFPMRHDPKAASDTCQSPAISAVQMSNGDQMWRCGFHEGLRDRKGGRGAVIRQLWRD